MIAKMNKFTFLIYYKDYETFLEKLRDLGVVHVEVRQSGEMDESMQPLMQRYIAYKNLLKEMSVRSAQYTRTDLPIMKMVSIEKIKAEYDAKCGQLQAQVAELALLDKEIKVLEPWGNFDWNQLDALQENGWNVQFFSCPERTFHDEWLDECNAIVINRKEGQCFFITINQQPVTIDAEAVRLPHKSFEKLLEQKKDHDKFLEVSLHSLSDYCAAAVPAVEEAIVALQDEIDLMKVRLGGEKKAKGSLILLEGWAPLNKSQAVQSMLEQCDVYFEMRPAEKEDNAPIKLNNNRVTRLFETLTRMYGLPDYGEFDPTPLLAPFYALFFGLCLGDAGYGLFLVLFGFILKAKVGKSMQGIMNLLITLGIAATVVGAILGTFFGVDLVKIDIPQGLKNFMISGEVEIGGKLYYRTMILALIVGMIHICFAMTVKAICSTVRYGLKNSLSDWGWLLLIGGSVSVATLNYMQIIPGTITQVAFYVIGGVSAIGIFLLNNLHRNVFMNVGAGLWATYNMATGLMGDLLSYLRLYALGLAGGLLGGVFNDLGLQAQSGLSDVLWGIPGWIVCGLIFVCGHALNIALSCLSAYVHSIRLTFVEYFKNSGYDGRGVMYKPFSSVQKSENKEIN